MGKYLNLTPCENEQKYFLEKVGLFGGGLKTPSCCTSLHDLAVGGGGGLSLPQKPRVSHRRTCVRTDLKFR